MRRWRGMGVGQGQVCTLPLHTTTTTTTKQELELHVLREEDDEIYGDIDTLDRVFIRVAPEDCMGYHPRDIDQSVLDLV